MSAADRRDVERVAGALAANMAAITAHMELARYYDTAAYHALMTPLAKPRRIPRVIAPPWPRRSPRSCTSPNWRRT